MKTSCIQHCANMKVAVLHEDYLQITEGDHCAAILLKVFEYYTNAYSAKNAQAEYENALAVEAGEPPTQTADLWIYKSQAELSDAMLGMFGEKRIRQAVAYLEERGFIETRRNPKYKFDAKLQYRLNTKAVQAALNTLEMPDRDGKNAVSGGLFTVSGGKNAVSDGKNAEAILKNTIKNTEENTKRKKKSPGGSANAAPPAANPSLSKLSSTSLAATASAVDGEQQNQPSPREIFHNLQSAIVALFGWEKPTRSEYGMASRAAKELAEAGYTPDDVRVIYAYCQRNKFSGMTPLALVKHAGSAMASANRDAPIRASEVAANEEKVHEGNAAIMQQITHLMVKAKRYNTTPEEKARALEEVRVLQRQLVAVD